MYFQNTHMYSIHNSSTTAFSSAAAASVIVWKREQQCSGALHLVKEDPERVDVGRRSTLFASARVVNCKKRIRTSGWQFNRHFPSLGPFSDPFWALFLSWQYSSSSTGLRKRNGAKLRESFCPAAASHSRPRQAVA